MEKSNVPFSGLDLGSAKPISVPMETITVVIGTKNLMGNYAKAFIKEADRVNPLRLQQTQLTSDEMVAYSEYLLTKRIECVRGECTDFRKLKQLYIPVWIQYNLAMIGEVVIRDKGLRMVPVMEHPSEMTFEDALKISDKVGMLEDDLQMVKDAMPRKESGDPDVMTTALIAGYVRSMEKVEHVSSTYVTAFLGMKLREEAAMKILYRIQYDDLEFIATALSRERGILR